MVRGSGATARGGSASTAVSLGVATALCYLLLTLLVARGRTRGLDSSVYELLRPSGVWGPAQRFNASLVAGLDPRVAFPVLVSAAVRSSIRRRSWRPLVVVCAALAATVVVTLVTKALVHRVDTAGAYGTGGSFPSGHAASVTVCVVGLAMLVRARTRSWQCAALVLLTPVASAPILAVGMHWLTDVIGGILLGLAVSLWLYVLLLRDSAGSEALGPTGGPNGSAPPPARDAGGT
ncbi:phosphatase PAP2 family protein [Phycicoccus sp. Soil748]|uniref:phosphatase PAP2 family protein n=1 Tax=Phycicoccus sp. Soil748 TaxID=1736397 RepID=UPI000702CFED|nr:phosphatase PAP2 family protein [Phycicoccus sp. Soil748]KRE55472.1 hypothetical protein ASG70_08945 [Phycicoccus sp. Soil748]